MPKRGLNVPRREFLEHWIKYKKNNVANVIISDKKPHILTKQVH